MRLSANKFFPLLLLLTLTGCSINKMAIKAVSDALTGPGNSGVFTSDSDPELVGEALPFAVKMYESLLAANPDHQGLLFTTGSLLIMYANAFVQGPADMLPVEAYEERESSRERAKKLYLRGTALIYRALDKKRPGFSAATDQDGTLGELLKKCKKDDAGLLYWAVAGGMAAYAIDVFDFEQGVRIREWTAMFERAYELDPDYDGAALDEFGVILYASLPEMLGGDKERAKEHYRRALEKTNGQSAGLYVSYAQSICVPAQDYPGFQDSLEKALAIDVDAAPSNRLVNIINQRKAAYLQDTAYNYFSFLPGPDEYQDEY